MRRLVLLFLFAMPFESFALGQSDAPPVKEEALSAKPHYTAYWLLELKPGERANYQRLLIVQQPLERLAKLELPPRALSANREGFDPLPFDHAAITFETYGKDSLWSDPFACVKKFGEYDQEAKTLVVDGLKSRVEACSLDEVIKLLENPLGKGMVHRRAHPLSGAELTAKAFVMLLKEQMAAGEKAK